MTQSPELLTAIELSRKAGAAIMGFYEADYLVEQKNIGENQSEPVTIADKTASRIIVEGLTEAFPEDGILSEEEADTSRRLSRERLWLIDPMDGTKGFVSKNGDFAVQIGFAVDGRATIGVVYLPLHDVLYFAEENQGAYVVRGGNKPEKLNASNHSDFSEMTIAVSRDHRGPKMSELVRRLGVKAEIERGSVGIKIGLIADQTCDLYVHLSPWTKHWDSAAPEVIIREAGGDMTDIFGETLVYNSADVRNHNGLLATNGTAHKKAVAILRPLLTEIGRLRVKN